MDAFQDLLVDGFSRVEEGVGAVVDGLSPEQLRWRPDDEANPAGWLLWHLLRQQDAQLAPLLGREQAWDQGWRERFDLPYPPDAMGYGQDPAEVGRFALDDPQLLVGYAGAVHELTRRLVDGLDAPGMARVLDDSYDPPVTVGVRLCSVLEDALKHLGQAEYVAGLVRRRQG
ncbi:mycothiol transferase [Serinicoccus chungangensis]|uniref:mycothiol transferase n=1 Tax=Serinicoccus chungangensis TaxID=767452 RepID=UPI001118BBD3|nr:DinB family protein [Serinicoccus chungangensis]